MLRLYRLLERRIKRIVPADISIFSVQPAPQGFDARFSASDRVYVYRIADEFSVRDPRLRAMVLRVDDTLDVDVMNQAARLTIGLHDFGSFALPNPGERLLGGQVCVMATSASLRFNSRNCVCWGAEQRTTQAVGADPRDQSTAYEISSAESGLLTLLLLLMLLLAIWFVRLLEHVLLWDAVRKLLIGFADKIAVPAREGFNRTSSCLRSNFRKS